MSDGRWENPHVEKSVPEKFCTKQMEPQCQLIARGRLNKPPGRQSIVPPVSHANESVSWILLLSCIR